MSCDEKTIRFMQIEKARYGTILLDSLNKERRITNNLFCHAVMISPSAYGLKLRIKKIIGKPIKIWTQRIVGSAFVLICIFFCFFSTPLLSGLNEEETIRQYIYYSNQDYQEGMKRLCLYDEWDYFFHSEYKVTGDVIAIHKSGNQFAQKKQQETYKVELEQSVDGTKKSQNETIILVKDSEDAGWKIDMRFA